MSIFFRCVVIFLLLVRPALALERIEIALYDAEAGQWHPIKVEIAATPKQRQQGLMGREFLAENAGMLFVYPRERNLSFWMKNTPLSLDIMYFSKDGIWVSTAPHTTPLTLESYPAAAPAQYVIEMVAGSAERLNIGAGSRFVITDCAQLSNQLKGGLDFRICSR